MDARKCKWEHPRCKALDCNGRCVALTDTSFPRRMDCPFYDNSAKFKPTAEQQAEEKRRLLETPEIASDYERAMALGEEIAVLDQQCESLLAEWERLSNTLAEKTES